MVVKFVYTFLFSRRFLTWMKLSCRYRKAHCPYDIIGHDLLSVQRTEAERTRELSGCKAEGPFVKENFRWCQDFISSILYLLLDK